MDVQAAQERGQLTVVDADESCPASCATRCRIRRPSARLRRGRRSDRRAPEGATQECGAWGEMVNVLWERGDIAASMKLEDLFDQLNKNN